MESLDIDLDHQGSLCFQLTSLYYFAVCDNADAAEIIRILAEETSKVPIAIAFYALILCYGYGLAKDIEKAGSLTPAISQSLQQILVKAEQNNFTTIFAHQVLFIKTYRHTQFCH